MSEKIKIHPPRVVLLDTAFYSDPKGYPMSGSPLLRKREVVNVWDAQNQYLIIGDIDLN